MIERKKEYIMDALGELEDGFIAEAAEYVKSKAKWKYWREAGAAAACVAAIAVTAATFQYLPIGKTTKTEATFCSEKANTTGEGTTAGDEEAVKESAVMESTAEAVCSSESKEVLEYSKGIVYEIVTDEQTDLKETAELDSAKTECWEETEQPGSAAEKMGINGIVQSSCVTWRSAEEIFAQGNDIFMGTVTNKQVYHATGKMDQYFTVVTVEVKDSIRGEMAAGDQCRIYLPVAEVGETVMTNSLAGDLLNLEIGSNAIFMPKTATKDTGLGKADVGEWLCYADFADYYFSEGMRYLFLETEEGVSYEADVYEISGEDVTLEAVAAYIRGLISEE